MEGPTNASTAESAAKYDPWLEANKQAKNHHEGLLKQWRNKKRSKDPEIAKEAEQKLEALKQDKDEIAHQKTIQFLAATSCAAPVGDGGIAGTVHSAIPPGAKMTQEMKDLLASETAKLDNTRNNTLNVLSGTTEVQKDVVKGLHNALGNVE